MSNETVPEAPKRGPGRPRHMLEGYVRRTASLAPEEYATALRLGAGNVSEGIRQALQVSARIDPKAAEAAHATGTAPAKPTVV